MLIQRRRILQSAALLPLVGAVPGLVHAQVPPLAVGVNRNIFATPQYVGHPQYQNFNLGLAYLYTNGAAGVFIDIVPQPANGGHAGICFNAAPNRKSQWQYLHPSSQQPPTQELWFRGVGVIFHTDGRIESEQWIETSTGGSGATNFVTLGHYPANTVLRVTATTNPVSNQTDLAVYSLDGAGNVVALLGSITLFAEYIGDRAGVFVIGGGNIQVQPYAIYP